MILVTRVSEKMFKSSRAGTSNPRPAGRIVAHLVFSCGPLLTQILFFFGIFGIFSFTLIAYGEKIILGSVLLGSL